MDSPGWQVGDLARCIVRPGPKSKAQGVCLGSVHQVLNVVVGERGKSKGRIGLVLEGAKPAPGKRAFYAHLFRKIDPPKAADENFVKRMRGLSKAKEREDA